jgi:hypothetical protein
VAATITELHEPTAVALSMRLFTEANRRFDAWLTEEERTFKAMRICFAHAELMKRHCYDIRHACRLATRAVSTHHAWLRRRPWATPARLATDVEAYAAFVGGCLKTRSRPCRRWQRSSGFDRPPCRLPLKHREERADRRL